MGCGSAVTGYVLSQQHNPRTRTLRGLHVVCVRATGFRPARGRRGRYRRRRRLRVRRLGSLAVPFTPFHGPIGLACKAPLGKRFSFSIFVATQVVIDLESGYYLFTQQYPVHRFLHTFVGASLACLFVALVLRTPCEWLLRVMPDEAWPKWVDREPSIPLATALWSALAGVLGHVVPDAIMHADARPFAPLSDANPFLLAISLEALHLGLVVLAATAVAWMWLARAASRR